MESAKILEPIFKIIIFEVIQAEIAAIECCLNKWRLYTILSLRKYCKVVR